MFKVLSILDADEWHANLQSIKAEDVFFLPEYCKINENIFKGEAECFYFKNKDITIMYPYIKRMIDDSGYYDISSAYGYGGYIGWPRNQGIAEFRGVFHRYCVERKIVSEFIRFHPLYDNHFLGPDDNGRVENWQPVILAECSIELSNIYKLIKSKAREKIRKAEKNRITIVERDGLDYLIKFIYLYYKTMERLQASQFYFFNEKYFSAIINDLKCYSKLFVAYIDKEMVGGLLIFYGRNFSYNFLSCSEEKVRKLGVKDLLQWKVLEWAHRNGKQKHLLGGGRRGEDSLFRFKEKFSPVRKNYYIGKVVHLPEQYAELCKRNISLEFQMGGGFDSGDWFPLYRKPDEFTEVQ